MSRTIKTVKRPLEHVYDEDLAEAADHKDRRPCKWLAPSGRRCGLIEANSVHITSEQLVADLPPTPPEDRSSQIIGEG